MEYLTERESEHKARGGYLIYKRFFHMREHALIGVPMRRWRRMMGSMHDSYSLSKRYSVVLRYLRPNGAENDVCPLR